MAGEMMNPVTWIIMGSLGIVCLVALTLVISLRGRLAAAEAALSNRVEKIEGELSAILDGTLGMGQHLQEVQRDLKDTREKQQQLEQRDLGALPYNQAVRMVGSGAGVDELINHCGLSRSEADLVMLLHQKSPPVVTPMAQEEQPEPEPLQDTPRRAGEQG